MSEIEKMRSGESPDFQSDEIQESFKYCKMLLCRLNATNPYMPEYRGIIEKIIPNIPKSSVVCPPFFCDHGHGIELGENVFVNMNCTFLDGGMIKIGDHSLIGPNVQIYTPQHPLNADDRRTGEEHAYPVTIGRDCWIGGGAIICPGVTIGDRCVIGAGSVVTKDIPADSVAVGNPAHIIKRMK